MRPCQNGEVDSLSEGEDDVSSRTFFGGLGRGDFNFSVELTAATEVILTPVYKSLLPSHSSLHSPPDCRRIHESTRSNLHAHHVRIYMPMVTPSATKTLSLEPEVRFTEEGNTFVSFRLLVVLVSC